MSLRIAFESFAGIGNGSKASLNVLTMDNDQFAKLCRDAKVIDKKAITSADVDIIFKKVLFKGEHRINFDQFQQALRYLAEKKFPGDGQGFQKLSALVSSAQPNMSGTQADASGIFSRITDISLYMGSHKESFDENAKDKGPQGRDTVVKTSKVGRRTKIFLLIFFLICLLAGILATSLTVQEKVSLPQGSPSLKKLNNGNPEADNASVGEQEDLADASAPDAAPLADPPKKCRDKVAMLAEEGVYRQLQPELHQYKVDVEARFPVDLMFKAGRWTNPSEIRSLIRDLHNCQNVTGVILVGALPMHEFHMHHDISIIDKNHGNPNPLYYEDFDLNFLDTDNDGVADHFEGVPTPKVWVSNMRMDSNLAYTNVELLRKFLKKTHRYYLGQFNVENRAISVGGKQFTGFAQEFATSYGNPLFGQTDVIIGENATKQNIMQALQSHAYQVYWTQTHSSYYLTTTEDDEIISAAELLQLKTGAVLNIQHGCSTCNWVINSIITVLEDDERHNVCISMVAGDHVGQAAIGNVRSGMAWIHQEFMKELMNGKYVGQAYLAAKKILEPMNAHPTLEQIDSTGRKTFEWVGGDLLVGNPFVKF